MSAGLYQLPLGPWPYSKGIRLRSRGRPWWGEATADADEEGRFTLIFRSAAGLVSRWRYTENGWRTLDMMPLVAGDEP